VTQLEKESTETLDSIAFGNKTYREIFASNLVPLGDFESGLSFATINAGTPVISDETYKSYVHSLKCFGTTSQQIRTTLKRGNGKVVAFMQYKLTRYSSGGGVGVSDSYSNSRLKNTVNTDFQPIIQIVDSTSSEANVYYYWGTQSRANADAYIDDIGVINLTTLFGSGNEPTESQFEVIYNTYISLKNKNIPYSAKEQIEQIIPQTLYACAVLDASNATDRFIAAKQLLDIAVAKENNPEMVVPDSMFTAATKGAVIKLPVSPAMYQNYSFDAIYSKNGDTATIPASTTKVMSLITGLDYVGNINERITIKSFDISSGSGNNLQSGDIITIRDLMFDMMLPSSNTAAKAFARVCGEKMLKMADASATPTDQQCYDAFIAQMAVKAAEIGMNDSQFVSASGLSASNQMTANDMIRMVVEACSYPEILKIWNKKEYKISVSGTNARSVTIETSVANQTLEDYYYIFGGKTGSFDDGTNVANALVLVAGR
jgi:hypothetical protein